MNKLVELNNRLLNSLTVYQSPFNKIRIGQNQDGGYVICDSLKYDAYFGCGVSNDVSFDLNFKEIYSDCELYKTFDGTVSRPYELPIEFLFENKNISYKCDTTKTDLNEESQNFQNIFLKMDIEGCEFKWINCFKNFHKIKQFVVEVHGLFTNEWHYADNHSYIDIVESLEKINKTHYLIHIHPNNFGKVVNLNNQNFSSVCELTFIRKDDFILNLNSQSFPISGLDFNNDPYGETIKIDGKPFVNI